MTQYVHKGLKNDPVQKALIIMECSASEMPELRKIFKQKIREPFTTWLMKL